MKSITQFVLFTLAVFLLSHNSWATSVVRFGGDDVIYINGTVITMDPARPYAEAFAVTNGRFSAIGTNAEIRRMAKPSTKIIDLKGMTVTPGFNDTHLHPSGVYDENSPYYVPWLGPEKVHNMDELIAVLKAKADKTPPGQLVRGVRYQDTKLGRHPTRYDLDKVSTEHPISISHSSGHITVVNSYILKASGITKDTQDPPGGSLGRDPDGTPNGIIEESASRLLRGMGNGSEPRIPFDAQVEGYLECFRNYARVGITSIGIAGGSPQSFRLYDAVRAAGAPIRMAFMFSESNVPSLKAAGIKSGFGDDHLRITSIKVFHGNSLSGRTCWLSEPYSDRADYYGIPPARSQERLDSAFQAMHDAGFQTATHSNGDREIDMVLTAIEHAQAKNPRPDARHRIEHASIITLPLLERARKAGVILVFHSYMWEHGDKLASYGEKRLQMTHAFRTAIDMGISVAGHSDATVSAANPMLRIQDMVTRKGENGIVYGGNQRVTVEEAIKVWTIDGAYTTFEEKEKGSITPGKLADFVVLRKDPRKVSPDAIKDIIIDATYVGGNKVWQAPKDMLNAIHNFVPGIDFGDGDEEENLNHVHEVIY
ncbi:amidohydrolase [Chitinophaga sp. 30R24]|uniref:amidohydrolase n=1 Tax=Chitinophaga sp. 30R24 TaxID=3248838 RepID=UPI003B8F5FD4